MAVGVSEPGAAIDGLRDTWSRYVSDWHADPALNLGVGTLGEEWGGPAFADLVVEELAGPYLGSSVDVLELGCGGGKFSLRLAARSGSLVCSDISAEMIDQTRATLTANGLGANVEYRRLNGVDFEGIPSNSIDFVFSYDVLLHLQPQNVFSYLLDARRILRAGGVFMLHQIDLTTSGGMRHFLVQYGHGTWKHDLGDMRRRGHIFFMSENQLRALATAAGYSVARIAAGFPPAGHELWPVNEGRDLIAFLDTRAGNRLRDVPLEAVRLVQLEDDATVHALWGGRRAAIQSADYLVEAGFDWERVQRIEGDELAHFEEIAPLEPWEWPRRAPEASRG
jgi:2-polyprenyl-3-methyl-5-hydroxy-6-metoxy-1,4-benzoquinol methylase